MHETTHFSTEVNSQVVNLQCVSFQSLQMCTKFQLGKGKSAVTGLPNKYHTIVHCLLQIAHKQVCYVDYKKQCEDIIIDMMKSTFMTSILLYYH